MKRWLPALSATLVLFAYDARAECDERPNALVADLGLHVVNVGYQRSIGCHVALQASAGIYRPWTVNYDVLGLGGGDDDPDGDVGGFVLRVRPFVHPLGAAPTGFWLSPFGQVGPVSATRGGESVSGIAYAAGLSAGYTFSFGERVLLAIGAGAQYHAARLDGSTDFPGFARFAPTLDLNVGYAF